MNVQSPCSHSHSLSKGPNRILVHTIHHLHLAESACNGGNPLIRWKHDGDQDGIVQLVRTQLVPVSPWQHPRDGRLRSEVEQRLRRGATLVISQSKRSRPLAFLHMQFIEQTLFIDLLAVDTQYQNRRWGSELMSRAENYGRKKGCTVARLFVDEGNARAHRFYERLGYTTMGHIKALKCYELSKPLMA
jgi:ribosomal protein S18 acetylase RimI-like enzyme